MTIDSGKGNSIRVIETPPGEWWMSAPDVINATNFNTPSAKMRFNEFLIQRLEDAAAKPAAKKGRQEQESPLWNEIETYKCLRCGFTYYEAAGYCTNCGRPQGLGNSILLAKSEAKSDAN